MSIRSLTLGAALVAALPSLADAQDPRDPRCTDPSYGVITAGGDGGDACQKAIDIFNYVTPQLGSSMAGGNATLGQGGALGGFGRFAVLLRVTAVQGSLPDVDDTDANGGPATTPANFAVEEMPLPLPSVDGALGLFGGIPLGVTSVLGVDALASVYFMPEYEEEGSIAIRTPDGSFKFGYGARIGIIAETSVLPGVSATWMRRQLPRISIVTEPSSVDEISLANFDNEATSWRVVAGKHLGPIALSIGAGQDSYESSAQLGWHVEQGNVDESQGSFAFNGRGVEATSYFANLMLDLKLVQLVGELGQVSVNNRSAADFFNHFDEAPDSARLYGSLGFRVGRD